MADSTLGAIRTKVRRLTRSPSTSQLTDAQIDEYVNTFFLYDFPEHLRLFSLRTTFTFYTEAFIDTYDSSNASDALFNFQNRFVTFHPPAYIAGFTALFSQSEAQFFAMYPKIQSILSLGVAGDGVTTAFAGTIQNAPFLRNNVVISSVDANALTLVAKDVPLSVSTGSLVDPNTSIIIGLINYITGVFNVTFPSAPAAGAPIKSEVVPYKPTIPQSILFYDNKWYDSNMKSLKVEISSPPAGGKSAVAHIIKNALKAYGITVNHSCLDIRDQDEEAYTDRKWQDRGDDVLSKIGENLVVDLIETSSKMKQPTSGSSGPGGDVDHPLA